MTPGSASSRGSEGRTDPRSRTGQNGVRQGIQYRRARRVIARPCDGAMIRPPRGCPGGQSSGTDGVFGASARSQSSDRLDGQGMPARSAELRGRADRGRAGSTNEERLSCGERSGREAVPAASRLVVRPAVTALPDVIAGAVDSVAAAT